MTRAARAFAIAVLLAAALPASAALAWERTTAESSPDAKATAVVAEFPFTNSGSAPVKIVSVKASCSCTTATLDKTAYAPGESGTVKATFLIGERTGEQSKSVTVTTDDADHPLDRLTIVAHLPPQPEIRPRIITWKSGEAAEEKTATIVMPPGLELTVDKVAVLDEHGTRFSCALETVESGRSYRLRIAPAGTAAAAHARIEITTPIKDYHLYARVLRPEAPAHPAAGPAPTPERAGR